MYFSLLGLQEPLKKCDGKREHATDKHKHSILFDCFYGCEELELTADRTIQILKTEGEKAIDTFKIIFEYSYGVRR